jgi:hypothetical protein
MIGSSAQLIEKILDAHQALGLDRFFGQIDWGALPATMVKESVNPFNGSLLRRDLRRRERPWNGQ